MGAWDRFANQLSSLEEAPELHRRALRAALPSDIKPRLLVYGPSYRSLRQFSPSTVLVVTDRDWAVAVEKKGGGGTVHRSDFANLLALELTEVLLYGRLQIQFAVNGRSECVAMEFNTVMRNLYEEAVQLLLDGADASPPAKPLNPRIAPDEDALLGSLPFKFYDAVARYRPQGQRLCALNYHPAILRRRLKFFQRELASAGVLALTNREWMLVTEEKNRSWNPVGKQMKYGNVVTHCPLSRLAGCCLRDRQPGAVATLEMQIQAIAGAGTVAFDFPPSQRDAVAALVKPTSDTCAAGVRAA